MLIITAIINNMETEDCWESEHFHMQIPQVGQDSTENELWSKANYGASWNIMEVSNGIILGKKTSRRRRGEGREGKGGCGMGIVITMTYQ